MNGAKDLIDIARKIRPVLAGYLRYRFPNKFPANEWLGYMIGRIRNEGAQHPMHPALEELEGINNYSKKYHHDTNPGKADSELINDGELKTYVQHTLAIAGGYEAPFDADTQNAMSTSMLASTTALIGVCRSTATSAVLRVTTNA